MKHLEGIVVLNEYMTYATPWFVLLFFGLAVIFFIATMIAAAYANDTITTVLLIFLLLFLVLFVIGACGVWDIEKGMVYECTVSDNITYKELTETYKVIEQRGEIYKLKFVK